MHFCLNQAFLRIILRLARLLAFAVRGCEGSARLAEPPSTIMADIASGSELEGCICGVCGEGGATCRLKGLDLHPWCRNGVRACYYSVRESRRRRIVWIN